MSPALKLEVEWVPGSGSFADISADLLKPSGVSIMRGRNGFDRKTPGGTMSLTLRNDSGQYTPDFMTGANYPNVRRGRRVKLSAYVNGVWKVRFAGYANQWGVGNIMKGVGSTCTLTCVDGLGFFNAPMSATAREVLEQAGCVAYWPLTETDGTVFSEVMGRGFPSLRLEQVGATGGTADLASGTAIPVDPAKVLTLESASLSVGFRLVSNGPLPMPSSFTIGYWEAETGIVSASTTPVLQLLQGGSVVQFYRPSSSPSALLVDAGTIGLPDVVDSTSVGGPGPLGTGFQMLSRSPSTWQAYDISTLLSRTLPSMYGATLWVGGGPLGAVPVAPALATGHVFILNRALTNAQMDTLNNSLMAAVAVAADTRVAQWYQWSGEPQSVTTSGTALSTAYLPTDGQVPGEFAQTHAGSLLARFLFNRSGQPKWIGANHLPVAVTIPPGWLKADDFNFTSTPDQYLSQIEATLPTGGTFTYARTSPEIRKSDSITGVAADDDITKLAATWLVNSSDGGGRVPQVTLRLDRRTAAEQAQIADLDITSRLVLSSLPETLPATMAVVIEGYMETFTDTWDQTWNLSADSKFVLGDPISGVLGSTFRLYPLN